ncbi:MAG: AMP-binding protein, partial [Candidatus Nanopelagicales bacterium]
VTSQQFLDQVKAVAKGIVASGVEPGQRVGIMSRTRYDWTVADYAIWYAGATGVPVYETSSAEQVQWILGDAGAVGVFLESAKNKAVFDEVSHDLPDCSRVWIFDDGALDTLAAAGAGISDEELESRRATLTWPRQIPIEGEP